MNKSYFPIIDAILENLRGNGSTDHLNKQYYHAKELQKAQNAAEIMVESLKLGQDVEENLIEAMILISIEAERQGFINGFRIAQSMNNELFNGVPEEDGVLGGVDYPRERTKRAGNDSAPAKQFVDCKVIIPNGMDKGEYERVLLQFNK